MVETDAETHKPNTRPKLGNPAEEREEGTETGGVDGAGGQSEREERRKGNCHWDVKEINFIKKKRSASYQWKEAWTQSSLC